MESSLLLLSVLQSKQLAGVDFRETDRCNMILTLRYYTHMWRATVPCQKSSRNLVKSRKIATHQNHALISTSHHAMNRTPLGPINGNKTHRKELTPFTRGFILGKLISGVIPP